MDKIFERMGQFWLKVAARIITGDYLLGAMVCYPIGNECVDRHVFINSVSIFQITYWARQNYAPVVYAYPKEVEFTGEEDERIIWLGDIDREGEVTCGDLLYYLLNKADINDFDKLNLNSHQLRE